MICHYLTKKGITLVTFFSGFFFSLLFSFCFISNSYAADDISVIHNSAVSWTDIFPSCTNSCLDDYSYLLYSYSGSIGYSQFNIYVRSNGSQVINTSLSSSYPSWADGTFNVFIPLPFNGQPNNLLQFASNFTFNVPITFTLTNSIGSSPSGTINISENGTFDVTSYSEAIVNVAAEVIEGDYHNDLVNIYHAIIMCAGVCLVLYFFYCIYRMIIKSTGGNY